MIINVSPADCQKVTWSLSFIFLLKLHNAQLFRSFAVLKRRDNPEKKNQKWNCVDQANPSYVINVSFQMNTKYNTNKTRIN